MSRGTGASTKTQRAGSEGVGLAATSGPAAQPTWKAPPQDKSFLIPGKARAQRNAEGKKGGSAVPQPPRPHDAPQGVATTSCGTPYLSSEDMKQRLQFYHDLHEFMASIGQPIQRLPTLGFKELDLWVLYKEVTKRRGVDVVIAKKQWKEVADALNLPASCTDSGFRLRLHYTKYLEQYERAHFTPPPEIPSLDAEYRGRKPQGNTHERKRKSLAKPPVERAQNSSSDSMDTGVMSPITSCESPYVSSPPKKQRATPDVCVDLSRLESSSLQRYCKAYDLQGERKLSRQEMVSAVTEHFAMNHTPVVNELQTVTDFLNALHGSRRVLTS